MTNRIELWRVAVTDLTAPPSPPRPPGPWPSVDELIERAKKERAKPEWIAFDNAAEALMVEMADYYDGASDAERYQIRGIVTSNKDLTRIIPELVARQTEYLVVGDERALTRALAMASMADGRGSYRDQIVALERLYRSALDMGLGVVSAFERASELSSKEHVKGDTSLQELLYSFPDRFR
jgi:hypothetical protein